MTGLPQPGEPAMDLLVGDPPGLGEILGRLFRRHVVVIRQIDGEVLTTDRFWTRRGARAHALRMRSPFYDVLIDGGVTHPHIPPHQFVEWLDGPNRPPPA